MIDLELLGPSSDGESLVLTDSEGQRYQVPITDELRGSVRRGRLRIEPVISPGDSLRPRDIQALLRAGLSSQEIADEYHADVSYIRRFEAPIDAEKRWAIERARQSHIGDDSGGPLMEDLVINRLAARGVDPDSLHWSARRDHEGPWQICLTFIQGAAEHAATWTMAPSATSIEAVDQEGKWLTENATHTPAQPSFTQLHTEQATKPVLSHLSDEYIQSDPPVTQGANAQRTREALIDQLNSMRGRHQEISIEALRDDNSQLDDASENSPFALVTDDVIGTSATSTPEKNDTNKVVDAVSHKRLSHETNIPHTQELPADSLSVRIRSLARSKLSPPFLAPDDHEERHGNENGYDDAVVIQSDTNRQESPSIPDSPTAQKPPAAEKQNLSSKTPGNGDDTLPGFENISEPTTETDAPTSPKRNKRQSVPSWDEIVFGSRN